MGTRAKELYEHVKANSLNLFKYFGGVKINWIRFSGEISNKNMKGIKVTMSYEPANAWLSANCHNQDVYIGYDGYLYNVSGFSAWDKEYSKNKYYHLFPNFK